MDDIIRIAFTGRLRSGKSKAATHLWVDYDFQVVSFGDPIRRIADVYFSHLYEEVTEVCEFTGLETKKERKPRALLQNIGQLLRQIDEDVWIKQVESSVEVWQKYRYTKGIVIDDLRQPNEYEWAKDNGFVIVRVIAPESVRIERAIELGDDFDIADLTHETESYIDTFEVDYEIVNDGSIKDLERKVDEIIADIKAKKQSA